MKRHRRFDIDIIFINVYQQARNFFFRKKLESMQSSRGPLVFIIDTRQVSMLYIRLHSHDFFFRQLKEDIQVQSNKAQREARKRKGT